MNKVILLGNLGSDPEIRNTESGMCIANFSIATSFKSEKSEKTEWHRVVAFGKQAEVISVHVQKGSKLLVEGRLQTRAWEDRDGAKRYITEVVLERFEFAGGKSEGTPNMGKPPSQRHVDSYNIPDDDDIPF